MSIEEIREKYGDDVSERIQKQIDRANTNKESCNIYVDQESENIHHIYFAKQHSVCIYEVSPKRKRLFTDGEKTVYLHEVRTATQLMNELLTQAE